MKAVIRLNALKNDEQNLGKPWIIAFFSLVVAINPDLSFVLL